MFEIQKLVKNLTSEMAIMASTQDPLHICTFNYCTYSLLVLFFVTFFFFFFFFFILGMFFFYLVFQIGCWWFFHVVAFFWKLQYPFHAFKVEKLGRIKHIYIGCVITGLILPLIPILIILADYSVKLKTDESLRSLNATFASGGLGFCNWVNREAILYGFILPLSVLTATGTSLLVLIIRNIHKVSGPKIISAI